MSIEFGIYPTYITPQLWIGARGILKNGYLDIPWDRWSSEFDNGIDKDDFIYWVNNFALKQVEKSIKEGKTRGTFDSDSGRFRVDWDDKNSHGYLYLGFYNIKKEN